MYVCVACYLSVLIRVQYLFDEGKRLLRLWTVVCCANKRSIEMVKVLTFLCHITTLHCWSHCGFHSFLETGRMTLSWVKFCACSCFSIDSASCHSSRVLWLQGKQLLAQTLTVERVLKKVNKEQVTRRKKKVTRKGKKSPLQLPPPPPPPPKSHQKRKGEKNHPSTTPPPPPQKKGGGGVGGRKKKYHQKK